MKKPSSKNNWSHRLCLALTAGAALLGTVTMSQAQTLTTSYTNRFNYATNITGWNYWYDLKSGLMTLDTTMDNTPSFPGSGSLKYEMTWPGNAGSGQLQTYGVFSELGQYNFLTATIDATKYDKVEFDIHFDGSSPTNTVGDFCRLQVGFFRINYSMYNITNYDVPTSASNGWTHVTAVINKATAPAAPNFCAGVGFNITCYGGRNVNLAQGTGTTRFWIDNIVVTKSKEASPPPSLTTPFVDATPGLNLLLGSGQYDRTSLRLVPTAGIGWLGQPDTTYSFTIASFPNAVTYPNNQAHIFVGTPNANSSMDYNTPNLVWLNVQGNANGTATAYFRYKINEPNANTNMFGADFTNGAAWAGQLASLNASTAVGTWSMTFSQDTNVTLSGPGGVSTSFVMNPDVVALFADPLNVLFGAQPNNSPPATGQPVILNSASVTNSTGGLALIDDFLTDGGILNPSLWTISAANALNVQLFPNDPGQKIVRWSIPDAYFGLQVATNITGPWTALSGYGVVTPIPTFATGSLRNGLVPSANLGPNQSFFRMFTPKFTKLQVLMPGETADPGSITGKTGTPLDQNTNVAFTVTVNAVDANWNPAGYNSDHTIHITSTDSSAGLPINADMGGGTVSFSVTNNAVGSWTFTASDVTDPTKTANTGSAVNVNP